MDLLIAFLVFISAMVATLIFGYSTIIAIGIGLFAFVAVALHRGFNLKDLIPPAMESVKSSMVVIKVMAVIGLLTGIWRISGTIVIFVYYGIIAIKPQLFLIFTFLLSCLLSYAIGTSFGVAGTLGVIFMAMARSGGVNPLIAAGVIMSGVYFGDRCSPVSSSANLVAGVTETDILKNVKLMMKTGFLPLVISILIYGILSFLNPLGSKDGSMLEEFGARFNLSLWCFLPAVFMLVLPLFKVKVIRAMGVSIASAVAIAFFVQGESLREIVKIMLLGYHRTGGSLEGILSGGGLGSMVSVIVILIISSMYSGIFKKTEMLKGLQEGIKKICERIGRFPATLIVGTALAMVFCNQTIAILMTKDLMYEPYRAEGGSSQELAIDMENSVVLLACCIPWCIGCMIPLQMLGVNALAMVFAVYMYGVSLCYLFTKKSFTGEMRDGSV